MSNSETGFWARLEEFTMYLMAIGLFTGIASANVVLALGTVLVIRKLLADRDTRRRFRSGITMPLLLFLALYLTATIITRYPSHVSGFLEDKWVVSAYFVALCLPRSARVIQRTMMIFITTGLILACYALFQSLTGYDLIQQKNLEAVGQGFMAIGFYDHHLTFGGVALVVFLCAVTFVFYRPRSFSSLFGLAAALLSGAAMLVSYARSVLVGVVGGFALLLLHGDKRLRRIIVLVMIVGLVGSFVLVPGMTGRFTQMFESGQHDETPRLRLWQTAINIIKDHPLTGVGQSNWLHLFEKYKIPGRYVNTSHCHNDFLTIGVDAGLITLLIFLFMWLTFFTKSSQLLKNQFFDPKLKWVVVAGMSVVLSILVSGLFQCYLMDAEVANLVWFMVGITFSTGHVSFMKQ